MCVAVSFQSCRSTQYIPYETVRVEKDYINHTQIDTLRQTDSIYIHEKGDTVYVEKYRYIYRTINKIDTLNTERCDTIKEPYLVEKQLTKWQSFKMDFGGGAIIALVVSFIVFILYITLRSRKNK